MDWTKQLKRVWGIRKVAADGRTIICRRKGGFKNCQSQSETKASTETLGGLSKPFSKHSLARPRIKTSNNRVEGGRR